MNGEYKMQYDIFNDQKLYWNLYNDIPSRLHDILENNINLPDYSLHDISIFKSDVVPDFVKEMNDSIENIREMYQPALHHLSQILEQQNYLIQSCVNTLSDSLNQISESLNIETKDLVSAFQDLYDYNQQKIEDIQTVEPDAVTNESSVQNSSNEKHMPPKDAAKSLLNKIIVLIDLIAALFAIKSGLQESPSKNIVIEQNNTIINIDETNYDNLMPMLVEAMKELQQMSDSDSPTENMLEEFTAN